MLAADLCSALFRVRPPSALTGADGRLAEVPVAALPAVDLPLAVALVPLHTGVLVHRAPAHEQTFYKEISYVMNH